MTQVTILNEGEQLHVSIAPPHPEPVQVSVPPPERVGVEVVTMPVYFGGNPLGNAVDMVLGETPDGLINGSNATFTTEFAFFTGAVNVRLNGLGQKLLEDYQILNNTTILFYTAPMVGERVEVDYIKL